MSTWRRALVRPATAIRDVLRAIEETELKIALVTDEEGVLKGTVTDGDVRRALLNGKDLDSTARSVMNPDPITAAASTPRDELLTLMRARRIQQIPLVDESGRVEGLEVLSEVVAPKKRDNPVILMAGGLGTRLRPLTDDCPKPLLEVADKPILETILSSFIDHGFGNFYISVNYRADMIKEYFGDGAEWNVLIRYLEEEKRMGTAGPITLLDERPSKPFIVMNGDLLTKLNFSNLIEFHEGHQEVGTMCVCEHEMQVPYGVIQTEAHRIASIKEKPVQRYFVNAGIYVLDPEVIDFIPRDSFVDMPDVFEDLIDRGYQTSAFLIREFWQDVGRPEDYHEANRRFSVARTND